VKQLRPKYKMELIGKIIEKLFNNYPDISQKYSYLKNFVEEPLGKSCQIQNLPRHFHIPLGEMPEKKLIEIAIDLGIHIPTVLPTFPTFKRILTVEEKMSKVQNTFDEAYKNLETNPAASVAGANSALESLIKHILSELKIDYDEKSTLSKLTEKILKEFDFFPSEKLQVNVRNIGSSLISITQEIVNMRNSMTDVHGKGKNDYIIDDDLYSVFILNAAITVGYFLIAYFNKKYTRTNPVTPNGKDDIPF
jgi:HEPN domain-containing protein